MLKDIKTNLKTTIRDPVTILAVLITIVYFLSIYYPFTGFMGEHEEIKAIFLRENAHLFAGVAVMNFIFAPIRDIAFIFMGVVIAGNIFKDRRNNMFDIVRARNVSFLRYYLSKLISYYIMAVGLCITISIFWCVVYFIFYMPPNPNFDVWLFFLKFFKNILLGYSSCLLKTIALPVFLSALTGVPTIGAVFNAIYYYLWKFFGDVETYYYRFVHTDPIEIQRYANKLIQPEPSILVPFASDANIALLWQVGISATMLVISYFLLKRRFKEV